MTITPTCTDATAFSNARFGAGAGNIFLDNVACVGTERNLSSCVANTDTSDCSHANDASVRCQVDCECCCIIVAIL